MWGVENQRTLPTYAVVLFFGWIFIFTGIVYLLYKTEINAQHLQDSQSTIIAEIKNIP